MTNLYLKQDDIPKNWVIVSEKGHVVGGPKYFRTTDHAHDWARNFVSSWQNINLVLVL